MSVSVTRVPGITAKAAERAAYRQYQRHVAHCERCWQGHACLVGATLDGNHARAVLALSAARARGGR